MLMLMLGWQIDAFFLESDLILRWPSDKDRVSKRQGNCVHLPRVQDLRPSKSSDMLIVYDLGPPTCN